jgi:hypothetical protein
MTSTPPTPDPAASENRVDGPMSGVQANHVHGKVEIHSTSVLPERALKLRRATSEELHQVREYFAPPGGFENATRWLSAEPIVVLCGPDTGRHYAATRLLIDHGSSAVVELSRDRALDSVTNKDLRGGEGYIWDFSGVGDTAFTEWEWRHVQRLLLAERCRMVVIVDHERQVPDELAQLVRLTPPDAVEVSAAAVRRSGGAVEDAIRIVKSDLAEDLDSGTPPAKAVWAATLAKEIQAAELTVAEARERLRNGVDHAVATTYTGLSTVSYAMLMTTAILENQPYDEVVEQATVLDRMIRTAELPADKELRPRKVFATAKNDLLEDARAEVVVRDHPEHAGLTEETIRFHRRGWADAVLERMWVQYHVLRPIVLDWMGMSSTYRRFGGECALALNRLITKVPAHDPMNIADQLASSASIAKRYLAADTLAYLAGQPDHRQLVEKQLEDWILEGTARQRWTAAHLYGTRYSKGAVTRALSQLERIARKANGKRLVRDGVAIATIRLLTRPEDSGRVLSRVLHWCRTFDRTGGADDLRRVGMQVGLFASGLVPELYGGPAHPPTLAKENPRVVHGLTWQVLGDPEQGQLAIDWLNDQCREIELEMLTGGREAAKRRARIVRLARVITPDLKWWPRRQAVTRLVAKHPTRARTIRYIFRTAARTWKQDTRRREMREVG